MKLTKSHVQWHHYYESHDTTPTGQLPVATVTQLLNTANWWNDYIINNSFYFYSKYNLYFIKILFNIRQPLQQQVIAGNVWNDYFKYIFGSFVWLGWEFGKHTRRLLVKKRKQEMSFFLIVIIIEPSFQFFAPCSIEHI